MASNRRSEAVKLAAKGYRLTPLEGKKPITPDWTNRATSHPRDASQIWTEHPDANIGIVTGGDLVVLDMDPRNGGEASLAKLQRAVGPLPEATVQTGGGGQHWYFETSTPIPSGKLLPGLDIKGEGGQVVAPPSIHPETGKPYEFVNGASPLPLPEGLHDFIASHATEEAPDRQATDFITEGTRNDDLTRLAGWMRGQGANLHQIETALIALAKEAGLEVREAKRTARSISSKPSGLELDVAKVVRSLDVREEAHRRRRQRDAVVPELAAETLRDALERPRKPLTFTVAELHPQGGNTLFIAQRKAGKTTVSMNLVRCLADRTPFLGEFDVQPVEGRIAYLNYELNDDQCLQWLEDMNIRHRRRVTVLNLRGRPGCLWLEVNRPKVVGWLRQMNVSTMVVDPAGRAWRGVVDDENSNSQVREFTSILDEIKLEAGVQDLVLVHHIGKAHQDEGNERGRGASVLEDWPDAIWTLTKDDSGLRSFSADGRIPNELEAHDLIYDRKTRALTVMGTRRDRRSQEKELSTAVRLSLDQQELVKILEGLGGKASRTEIQAHAPWGDKKNRQLVAAAAADGVVKISLGLRDATMVELVKGSDDPG